VPTFRHGELSDTEFLQHWSEGNPIVITHVRQQGTWGPAYFVERYGSASVMLENCETGKVRKATVAEYFEIYFGNGGQEGVWKIKVSAHQPVCGAFGPDFWYFRIGRHVKPSALSFLSSTKPSRDPFHALTLFVQTVS